MTFLGTGICEKTGSACDDQPKTMFKQWFPPNLQRVKHNRVHRLAQRCVPCNYRLCTRYGWPWRGLKNGLTGMHAILHTDDETSAQFITSIPHTSLTHHARGLPICALIVTSTRLWICRFDAKIPGLMNWGGWLVACTPGSSCLMRGTPCLYWPVWWLPTKMK